ncbi:RNA polymerase sigma-70 factor, ECF subfamily [Arachidicoccus rhizosphaerae]|uniref:RNA polymerase sigma-70 factor, ECF subfamily n=2 Tax=Arachidicoccus rhizosphaerae TaxID=551991 RepID=A0A1H4AYM2_9BACT|nr:RNA polymerase sigma-70 factor, ECF subfamily [Arachidicoccus rhizosphaerae]
MMHNANNFSEISADNLLIKRARKDPKAFAEIYHTYFPLLLNIAYKKLESKPLAEDLVQEIFVALYQNLDKLEISCSLSAYLNKAIRFKIMNEYRSKAVRIHYSKTVFPFPLCKTDFSSLEVKELSHKLDRVYDQLPRKCRQVFMLSRREGLSQKAISQKLDISLSTVEKHIGKALKIFKDELHEYRLLIQGLA